MNAAKEIKAGSVVRLKSGGGTLTVGDLDAKNGSALCFWLAADGKLCTAPIPLIALEVL